MVAVFAIFATLGMLDFKMMGVGLAVAVFVDATVVRAVLLPATMKLLGDWNWYLPRWLEWLPHLTRAGAGRAAARARARARARAPRAHGGLSAMPELPGADVLRELQKTMQSVLERERGLQRDLLTRVFEPYDAAFDLLEQSGAALREQAEAIEHAARSLEQAAGLMKTQADLFERTVRMLREPSRRIESVVGLEPGRSDRKPSRRRGV